MAQSGRESLFEPGVDRWRRGLGKVRDAVRQELIARQLALHLPGPVAGRSCSVLDAGCGQGTQAIRLARAGFEVTGIDVSEELLGLARVAAQTGADPGTMRPDAGTMRPDAGTMRLTFDRADLLALPAGYAGRFDVVCCHGVLMYLPSLAAGLKALVGAARPGGIISVVTRNRAAIAMRAGMSGDWSQALDGFDSRYYRNRLGIDGVRADEPEEVGQGLAFAGADRVAWYGVRLFTDHWGPVDPPDDFTDLVEAEAQAGRRDPYRSVAALTHTIAIRRSSGP
jgi:S-adenosylmethionine-dependent methyltransferase